MNHPLLTTSFLLILCASSHAALTVYDPVTVGGSGYTAGSVLGQGPAVTGFTGVWERPSYSTSDVAAQASGLSYSNLVTSGGSLATASNSTRTGRPLSSTVTAATTGAVYISFLVSTGSTSSSDYRSVEFDKNTGFDDTNDRAIQVGVASGDFGTNGYGLRLFSNNSFRIPLSSTVDTGVHLVVLRLDQSTTNNGDSITAWFDPTSLGGAQPAGSAGTLSGFNLELTRFTLAQFGASTISSDELRIGTTWADVTPVSVPEPAAPLLGLLSMGLLRRRRK